MPNVFDYLKKYKDVPLSEMPFNLVDNLVLAELAYTDFAGIVPEDGTPVPLAEAYAAFFAAHDREELLARGTYTAKAPTLMDELCGGVRFGSAWLSGYVDELDRDRTAQLSAITVQLSDGTAYVAFRGTDGTVVGWKEDFLLSYMSGTVGQHRAVDYLDAAAARLRCPLRVGGHSKGGNFAVYAATFCKPETRDDVLTVYTNDGPGFRPEVTALPEYRSLMEKTVLVIPDTSVIGMLLTNACPRVIVKSNAAGIVQHDGFSWEIEDDHFLPATLSRMGAFLDRAIDTWVAGLDDETLESLVDTVFTLIEGTGEDTFHSMSEKKWRTAEAMFQTMRSLPREKQKELLQATKQLLQSGGSSAVDTIKQKDET